MSEKTIRPIAFYLPQYHPIPENDQWWGKGFTEWTNVTKAKPLFAGHYQPHLPADLGFYDLRLPEARQAQADLAREYGIYGFCYYHYWFNGRRLLDRPFEEVLAFGKPDFPFCLCWANENWTRRWDGLDEQVLIGQNYSEEDDRRHIRSLMTAFRDERYIKIDGKPLFIVYRANKLPYPLQTASVWREEVKRAGFRDVYLCRVESFPDEHADPGDIGFDAAIEFQPDGTFIGEPLGKQRKRWRLSGEARAAGDVYVENNIWDYDAVVERMLCKSTPPYTRFPCVTPSWDNTARRKINATILKNATPQAYEKWLRGVIERFEPVSAEENFVFINAWNEWAEGNHLEPCQQWGRAYLEATRRAISGR